MRWLQAIWEGWKRLAHRIGEFNTKLLLFLFYYLVLGPTAVLLRLFRRDVLEKRIQPGSLYTLLETPPEEMERARRQF